MVAEYFRAVWYLTFVDAFYSFLMFIFKKRESFYASFASKVRLTDEDARTLPDKVFKKKLLRRFKLDIKRGNSRIKNDYYCMKFCEKQMKALDIMYEINRTATSNGVYIQQTRPILDSYLEAKRNYELSISNYQNSVKALNDYIQAMLRVSKKS